MNNILQAKLIASARERQIKGPFARFPTHLANLPDGDAIGEEIWDGRERGGRRQNYVFFRFNL
jgi:hypothetical protein